MYPRIRWRLQRDLERRTQYAKKEMNRTINKVLIGSETLPMKLRFHAITSLDALGGNTSLTRIRNRCQITNRARGILSKYGISRLEFRRKAAQGLIPGIVKNS